MVKKIKPIESRRTFIKKAGASVAFMAFGNQILFGKSLGPNPLWKEKARMLFKLQEIYCGILNNKIHIAGGFIDNDGRLEVSSYHISYDPIKNNWQLKGLLPSARHHPQLVGHHDKLYVFGGFKAQSKEKVWIMDQQSWVFNEVNNSWQDLAPATRKHAEVVSASLGDFIHIVGGRHPKGTRNQSFTDHRDTNSHLVYDPISNSWQSAAPALIERNSAAGTVIKDLFYVVGGRKMNGNNLPNLEIYDPKEDKWRNGSPMPQGQGALAAASVGGKLYAFGGEYFDKNGGGVYKECWCYDPKSDQWSASIPMLTPRHGLGGVAIGNRIYSLGGAKKPSGHETSDVVESIAFD